MKPGEVLSRDIVVRVIMKAKCYGMHASGFERVGSSADLSLRSRIRYIQDQDICRADLCQLIHNPCDSTLLDHGADGYPIRFFKGGDGRGSSAWCDCRSLG